MQEVFFCRDGATESVSMTFKESLPLDSVAHHLGVATGSLQLRTRAGHFSATAPGELWTLEDLRFLCGPTAGTTAGSPIVVWPAPSAGEPEPWGETVHECCCMHAMPGGQGMMSCGGGNTMNMSWLELAMIHGPIPF